ncbi:hypothetical protein F5050DRAFT_1714668 [Lentinula boryana]|uniref:Uncharacterized protein n=1 Tax=Lentinula boryana TaxID=40481 RepID=A0ABQ8Q3C9_9AGAR|nr:hypothetical protein F5050DRAFT_1714668 [Lentinula boryana]
MQQLEEEAAKEAEERRKEEERLAKEKRKEEERKQEEERIAEEEKEAEELRAQARDKAFRRMVEESRKEKAKAVQELAERREHAPSAALEVLPVVTAILVPAMMKMMRTTKKRNRDPQTKLPVCDVYRKGDLWNANRNRAVEKLKPASFVTNNDNDAVGQATTHRGDLAPNGQGLTGQMNRGSIWVMLEGSQRRSLGELSLEPSWMGWRAPTRSLGEVRKLIDDGD